jgi:hypothetical protein
MLKKRLTAFTLSFLSFSSKLIQLLVKILEDVHENKEENYNHFYDHIALIYNHCYHFEEQPLISHI